MQGGSQNSIIMFQLKIDVAAHYLFGEKKITKSEDTRKIKFLSKSVAVEALAFIQFYLDEMMYHWQEWSLSGFFAFRFPS